MSCYNELPRLEIHCSKKVLNIYIYIYYHLIEFRGTGEVKKKLIKKFNSV